VTRRTLLAAGAAAASTAAGRRAPRLPLRSSWQSVNIGDIGHTPGALTLLETHFPQAEIALWPRHLEGVALEMIQRNYPRVKLVRGVLGSPEVVRAWSETNLYISGSGSGFPDSSHAAAFHRATSKPFGVFGVSTDPVSGFGGGLIPEGGTLKDLRAKALALPPTHLDEDLRSVLDRASFFFCRDSISVDYLRAQRAKTPILEFGPDAQLGMHLRDDARAEAYLRAQGLEPGKFICVIPRLRYTPYYRIDGRPRQPADDVKDAINTRTTEGDHAKLREMIVAYVNQTGHRVLACAEMTYQVEMAKQVLVDPLPADVKKNVVWRDTFWLPDEAASVYARAQAVISVECHSPLIALRNGTSAFYVRQPTDTSKGQMYRDFGAGEWFFELDETSGAELWSRLQAIVKNPAAARARVATIRKDVEARQQRMVQAAQRAARV